MRVKRDKSLESLAVPTPPSSTAEEYADAKALEREKYLRDKKMKAVYTVRNLMKDLGFYEFLRLTVDAMYAFDHTTHPSEQDGAVHQELYRIARALSAKREHPTGKRIFLSLILSHDESRAIAKWHNSESTKKATYAEISEFCRVVLEQNLEELIRELRPVLPAKIRRRRSR